MLATPWCRPRTTDRRFLPTSRLWCCAAWPRSPTIAIPTPGPWPPRWLLVPLPANGTMKRLTSGGSIRPRRTSRKLPLLCLPPPRLEFQRDQSAPDRFFPPQVDGYAHERQPPGNAVDQETPVREVDHQEPGRPHLHRRYKKPGREGPGQGREQERAQGRPDRLVPCQPEARERVERHQVERQDEKRCPELDHQVDGSR